MKTLFMETTRISPEQTVGEIQKILGVYGAAAIRTDYENGEVIGVSFLVRVNGQEIPFRLPCRWQMIFEHFRKRRKRKQSARLEEEDQRQAKRVAWRQILRWVEAQLALVDTGMVKTVEVFMPYMIMGKGQTFYERLEETKFKLVEYKGDNK